MNDIFKVLKKQKEGLDTQVRTVNESARDLIIMDNEIN